jgi:tRNA A-37 threonylcarbamoyl transferase component Bud32
MADANRIGRYQIVKDLSGSSGSVVLAKAVGWTGFERHVALRRLDADADVKPLRAVGRLHHQHIASVHELDRDRDGRYFLVIDYVHGRSAKAVWTRTDELGLVLPPSFAVTAVAAAASALHHAHAMGIVHGDVSPASLMLGYDGAIKLIDFGLVGATDPRADIFSLGIVLYELATMTRATPGKKLVPPTQLVDGFPRDLERVILTALDPDPANRFSDADAMRRELEACGRTHKLALGDAAIVTVMEVLFEERTEPWRPLDAVPVASEDYATVPLNAPVPVRPIQRQRAAAAALEEVETTPFEVATQPLAAPLVSRPRAYPRGTAREAAVAPSSWRRSRSWRPLWWAGPPTVIAFALVAVWLRPTENSVAASAVSVPVISRPVVTPLPEATPPQPAPVRPAMIRLHITTTPDDATVLLDGVWLGHTPFDGETPVTEGAHTIKIRRRGYFAQKLDVELQSDVTRDITLQPTP